jgi:hypothetical protein
MCPACISAAALLAAKAAAAGGLTAFGVKKLRSVAKPKTHTPYPKTGGRT